jgi:hypothetical protein
MPGIVEVLLNRRITYSEYVFLLRTSGVPWCMRARLINKCRKENKYALQSS